MLSPPFFNNILPQHSGNMLITFYQHYTVQPQPSFFLCYIRTCTPKRANQVRQFKWQRTSLSIFFGIKRSTTNVDAAHVHSSFFVNEKRPRPRTAFFFYFRIYSWKRSKVVAFVLYGSKDLWFREKKTSVVLQEHKYLGFYEVHLFFIYLGYS